MHSDLISKIEKARHYATQPERIAIQTLTATFRGGNNDHVITVDAGVWRCDCDFGRVGVAVDHDRFRLAGYQQRDAYWNADNASCKCHLCRSQQRRGCGAYISLSDHG
jgi:hypothetical protein